MEELKKGMAVWGKAPCRCLGGEGTKVRLVTDISHRTAEGQKEEEACWGVSEKERWGESMVKADDYCLWKWGKMGFVWTKWMSYGWEEKLGGWVIWDHNQSESETWITRKEAGAMNSQREERGLQMAGPKHMEVQAETGLANSLQDLWWDGTTAVPYPCGQKMSLNPRHST